MKKFTKILAVSICILALVAIPSYFIINKTNSLNKDSKTYGARYIEMSDEERREVFNNWKKEMEFYPSASEANKVLPFKLKLPKGEMTKDLKGIYVARGNIPEELKVNVIYNDEINGIYLKVWVNPIPPDNEQFVKAEEEYFKSGVSKADKTFKLIEVHGITGTGIEPGYNIIDGNKYPRPGSVAWWDNGVYYNLFGTTGENGTSLDQLLKIADSMYAD